MAAAGAEVLMLAPAVALVMLCLLLVACGGRGQAIVAPPSLAAAAIKSEQARTVRIDMQMTLVPGSQSEPLTMRLSGGLDRARSLGKFAIDLSGIGDLVGYPRVNEWKGREIVDAARRKLNVYIRLPIFGRIPGGKPWVKLDLNAELTGPDLALAQILQLMGNPGQSLDWLRAARGRPKTIGTERVGGEDTTHYRVIVNLASYPRLVPPSRRAAARRSIAALRRLTHLQHLRAHPVHVWVGQDGLVRKMSLRFVERVQRSRVLVAQIIWFHNFGSSVRVKIPRANLTRSFSQLVRGEG
jgi:hypothetical protein